jgi:deoxyribonuclease-1-like protein
MKNGVAKIMKIIILIILINNIICTDYTIGSFNVQVFGTTKMSKQYVVDVLVQIFRRYDIALIMEIRDVSTTAIYNLLNQINSCQNCDQYNITLSDRLGRTSSKEQYGYFYKIKTFDLLKTYQYPDPNDDFEREPYAGISKIKISII